MPLLYETTTPYIIKAKISKPLTYQQKQALHQNKRLMEQKANITIHKIETTPNAILFYCTPAKGFFIISMSVITAIAVIAAAIGLPITAWFLTQPPAPGPLGLPQYFWIGLGIGIPLIALGFTLYFIRKK